MEVLLKKSGNSTVLVLSPALLREHKLEAGSRVDVQSSRGDGITIRKARRYCLADLVAECDLTAPADVSRDMALWDTAKPVGNEVF